jgi:ABC-2 type transport system ATP-binding protein
MTEPGGAGRPDTSSSKARRRPVVASRGAAPLVPGAPPVRPAAGSANRMPRFDRVREPIARKGERGTPVPIEPEPGTEPMPIVAHGLTKRYGDLVAVDHLDLEIVPGEIFGLLGQNGAGKTTTILMLLGLTEPTSGWARVVGYDPTRRPLEVKRRVGYLPDAVGFYSSMTGRENLRYTARLNGLPRTEAEADIEASIEQVGMAARADDRVETYSRGMLQRLGIADALIKDPGVLILDEPTTAIDPLGVVEILDLLRRLAHERRIAILLSSHLLSQVQSVCDRVGIFAAGKLIGVGTVEELAARFGQAMDLVEVGFDLGSARDGAAAAAPLMKRLEGVPDVRAVSRADTDPQVVLVSAEAGAGPRVRSAILGLAAAGNLPLASVRQIVPSLDDIYRRALEQRGLAHHGEVAA